MKKYLIFIFVIGLSYLSFALISEYNSKKYDSPEMLVNEFLKSISTGNCEDAEAMATGRASEIVQGTMDAGCEPFETRIISIECDTRLDSSTCVCTEERGEMGEMRFFYHLVKAKRKWKVEFYEKDMSEFNNRTD